jgi:3D (Asp-Asp-Asp) domain-containing protein/septal ring factor EnvC (AmiA/AmiB activator)
VGVSCLRGPARIALAGLAAALALLASASARADDPAAQADRLRASNAGLADKAQQVLLQLYSLESRLRQAEQRIDAIEAQSARLERDQASAQTQLDLARDNMATARAQLGARLRQLYVEGEVDPLAVLLGAESLGDALSALDGLGRLAEQDTQIVDQLARARVALRAALARLAERRAELRATLAEAEAARSYLARTRSQQSAYLASLRRQQDLNRTQISRLAAQAAASEQQSEELASSNTAPPAPPPQGGTKMTVSSTGYCLRGTTATGIPVGWGVIAVDPAVIPLGTRMFVPGYGEGVAADTGSAVRGATIDVWFPTCTQALQWGRRTVTITIH